jgi:polysaccharide biosynthesis/export protein
MKLHSVILPLLLSCAAACYGQGESLLIGPGDLVHIQVFETADLEQHARVTDAGEVSLVLGGMVKVAGLTPANASVAIEAVLKRSQYLRAPHVTVTVEQYVTETVSILGQVKSPGSYQIDTPRKILDVLSLAGGITDLADRKVTIGRRNSQVTIEYYLSNNALTALNDNVIVYPGDTVVVPKADVVYVLGDVGRPGGFSKTTNDSQLTVLQAVSLAGGMPPTAATSRARLVRKTANGSFVQMPLPLGEMQKGKKPDIVLHADDIIYVPFSYLKNVAMGVGGFVAAASSAAIYHF